MKLKTLGYVLSLVLFGAAFVIAAENISPGVFVHNHTSNNQGGVLPSQVILLGEQASTSGTEIDFTGIPSSAHVVTMILSGVSTNGANHYRVQVGAGSYTTSGYLGSDVTIATGGNSSSNPSNGCEIQNGSGASGIIHGTIAFVLENGTTNKWVGEMVAANSDVARNMLGACTIALAGTLDRIRITTQGGTDAFDAGVINVTYQ